MRKYIKLLFAFFKVHYPLIITTCISLLVFHRWIFNLGYLASGDWPFYYKDFLLSFYTIPQFWVAYWDLGSIDLSAAFDVFKFLYGFLSQFFDYNISERLIYLWPSLIFSLVSSYLLLSHIFKKRIAVFIGMLVFNFNTYYLLLTTGDLTLFIAYSLGPLIIYLFIKSLQTISLNWALLNALVLFLSLSYEPRATYLIIWILFYYYVYLLYLDFSWKIFIKRSLLAFSSLFIAILLSSYWILPITQSHTLTNNKLFSRGLFGNEFLNINYAFNIFQPFWSGAKPAIFERQEIPFYFWVIPFAAFFGLYLRRKNRIVLFFGIITLLGIFLTKQVGQPFSGVYPWLYQYFPGFNAFREASKFFFLIVLGYSVLVSAFVDSLWEHWREGRWKIYGKYFLTGLIAILLLWNTKPFITGEIGTLFVSRYIPKDYLLVDNFILKQSTYFSTYWIPTYSRWSPYSMKHPEISAVIQLSASMQKFIEKDQKTNKYSEAELMANVLQEPYANKLLDSLSIKYVIIPLEDKANEDNFFPAYGKNRQYYIKQLDRLDYLKRINIGTKDILVYENKDFKPLFYTTNTVSLIKTTNPSTLLQSSVIPTYQYISDTQYSVQLSHIAGPTYLQFAENYHPDWSIRIGDFHWWDVLTQKNYFISKKDHFENDLTLNTFKIDPKEICQTFACVKNSDGSYDISMTIYFKSEAYMYLGVIISFAVLALILLYFCYLGVKKINSKK